MALTDKINENIQLEEAELDKISSLRYKLLFFQSQNNLINTQFDLLKKNLEDNQKQILEIQSKIGTELNKIGTQYNIDLNSNEYAIDFETGLIKKNQ